MRNAKSFKSEEGKGGATGQHHMERARLARGKTSIGGRCGQEAPGIVLYSGCLSTVRVDTRYDTSNMHTVQAVLLRRSIFFIIYLSK